MSCPVQITCELTPNDYRMETAEKLAFGLYVLYILYEWLFLAQDSLLSEKWSALLMTKQQKEMSPFSICIEHSENQFCYYIQYMT